MNCKYCDNELNLKQTSRGLYARCTFCKFSGYVPEMKVVSSSNRVVATPHKDETTFHSDSKVVSTPSKVETTLQQPCNKVETTLQLPCCAKYKTETGLKAHMRRVSEEENIHPRIYRKHEKFYGP